MLGFLLMGMSIGLFMRIAQVPDGVFIFIGGCGVGWLAALFLVEP
jgi:hypothetical protein